MYVCYIDCKEKVLLDKRMRKEAKASAEFDAELEILEQYNSQLPYTTLQPTS